MTSAVWKSLKVAEVVSKGGGRVTLSGLADLARGLGGGIFTGVSQSDKRSSTTETGGVIDLDAVCGGKLVLSKEVRLRTRPDGEAALDNNDAIGLAAN